MWAALWAGMMAFLRAVPTDLMLVATKAGSMAELTAERWVVGLVAKSVVHLVGALVVMLAVGSAALKAGQMAALKVDSTVDSRVVPKAVQSARLMAAS